MTRSMGFHSKSSKNLYLPLSFINYLRHPDYDVIKIWNSNAEQESQEKFRKRIYTLIPDQVTRDKAYPTYQGRFNFL